MGFLHHQAELCQKLPHFTHLAAESTPLDVLMLEWLAVEANRQMYGVVFPQLLQCVEIVQLGWVLLSTRGAPHCFWLGTIKALQSGEVVVLFQLLECGTVELTRS